MHHLRILIRGELSIDVSSHKVTKRGQEIFLTPTEFNILHLLATRPGTVYSRLQLLRQAMGEEYLYYERSIDTHVSNLRKKIEDNPSEPKYVETVFGVGYRFGEGAMTLRRKFIMALIGMVFFMAIVFTSIALISTQALVGHAETYVQQAFWRTLESALECLL